MKANYLLTLAAGLLMAGCAQNELTLESPDANPPVGFDVYTGVQTRGTETKIENVRTTGFGIFGYYTGQAAWPTTGANTFTPNFMFNQQATYAASTWGYTPVKYWPNTTNDQVTFFAYAPYSTTASSGIATCANTNTGNPYLDFTIQTDPTKHVDLVTASAPNQKKKAEAVNFTFNHVLSRANFFAKTNSNLSAESHVYIKAVTILGSNSNPSSKFFLKARYTFSADTWDYTTTGSPVKAVLQAIDYPLATILNLATPSNVGTYNTQSINVTSNTTSVPLFKDNHSLYFIPVDNATGLKTDNVKVKIEYDVVTKDTQLNGGHSKTSNTVTVALPNGTLQKGKAYNFTFEVSLTEIKVTSTTVSGWGTPVEEPVTPSI